MKFFRTHALTKKIALATAIKLAGLLLLWWLFFNHGESNTLTADQVRNNFLHAPSTTKSQP